jgi:hypothetical protein
MRPETGTRKPESLVGKFVRLPWSGAWAKILAETPGQIRVRSRRGKPAIWFRTAPDFEIRDKSGAMS